MTYVPAADRYDHVPIRRVGKTGLQLPIFALGLWHNFGNHANLADSRDTVLAAFDKGIFHFDLADNYGPEKGTAEETFGQILDHDLRPYRDELVVSTKAGFEMWPGPYGSMGSKKSLIANLDHSLKRLRLDYVDIFYSHQPDPNTAFEETADTMAQIVRSGKALYIGISNYNTAQMKEMAGLLKERHVPYVLNQFSYNMLNQEAADTGLLTAAKELGGGVIAYGPVAEGLLSDRYLTGIPADFPIHRTNKYLFDEGTDKVAAKLNQLNELAQGRQQTLAQMSLAWLLKDQVVTSVILGTSKIEHLVDNIKAAEHLDFTQDELDQIQKIIKG